MFTAKQAHFFYRIRYSAVQGGDHLEGFRANSCCFICGQSGHWAAHCPTNNGQGKDQLQVWELEGTRRGGGAVGGVRARTSFRCGVEGK